jgi:prepilin-type N-terminal cleavage/methylation domain-containing protein
MCSPLVFFEVKPERPAVDTGPVRMLVKKRIGDQRGMTLIELLVASAMSVVICGAAVTLLISSVRNQPKITETADQVGKASTVSEQMVTELRQGVQLETREKAKLVFLTYVHTSACTSAPTATAAPIQCRVTYTCATTGVCTKSVLNANGSGTARTTTLVSGISNPTEVFCFMPSTEAGKCGTAQTSEASTYVGIKLQFPNTGSKTVTTLENGATLRNATLGY